MQIKTVCSNCGQPGHPTASCYHVNTSEFHCQQEERLEQAQQVQQAQQWSLGQHEGALKKTVPFSCFFQSALPEQYGRQLFLLPRPSLHLLQEQFPREQQVDCNEGMTAEMEVAYEAFVRSQEDGSEEQDAYDLWLSGQSKSEWICQKSD